MQTFTEDQKALVAGHLLIEGGDLRKVAKKVDMSVIEVQTINMIVNKLHNYTPEGNGRTELQPYLIGKLDLNQAETKWDNKDPKIARARELYDLGHVEICQARDGMNMLLYAIPRKERDKFRYPYFATEEELDALDAEQAVQETTNE